MNSTKSYLTIGIGILLLTVCGILLMNTPDEQATAFIVVMVFFIGFGFYNGIFKSLLYSKALVNARKHIMEARKLSGDNVWEFVARMDAFFREGRLDQEFSRYKHQVNQQQANYEDIVIDIVDVINQPLFEAYTRKALVKEIPNTLTGLGILGTFVGLLQGISMIGFSSLEVVVESFSLLLSNISLAFYTSICGVILSTLFDWLYRYCWNDLMQELFYFQREFHGSVILSVEEQEKLQRQAFYERVLATLSIEDKEKAQEYLKNM